MLQLAREAGHHAAKHWIDGECGYAPTPPVEPEDEAAELARTITSAAETVRRATEALDRLEARRRGRR